MTDIKYHQISDPHFKSAFLDTIKDYEPPVLPKIIRTYKTNTGCVVNHTCSLILGLDYTNIVIGSTFEDTSQEEDYFKKFFPVNSELFYAKEEKSGMFITHISNRKELVEDD